MTACQICIQNTQLCNDDDNNNNGNNNNNKSGSPQRQLLVHTLNKQSQQIRDRSDKGAVVQIAKAVRVFRQAVSKVMNRRHTFAKRKTNGNRLGKLTNLGQFS